METQFVRCVEDKGFRIKTKVHYCYGLTNRIKKLVFVFFLILSHSVCFGQDIRNGSNMLVGRIEASGIVRDSNNMTIGKIESDGDVRDRNNMLVGRIGTNGTIRDKNNMMIGRVESDGTVRDRNNMTIGYAKGVPVTYAAVFLFFNLFK